MSLMEKNSGGYIREDEQCCYIREKNCRLYKGRRIIVITLEKKKCGGYRRQEENCLHQGRRRAVVTLGKTKSCGYIREEED